MRPAHCQTFNCAVLSRFSDGSLNRRQAILRIRRAQRLAGAARDALAQLAGDDPSLPLRERFFKAERSLHASGASRSDLRAWAIASESVHALFLLLSTEFHVEPQTRPRGTP